MRSDYNSNSLKKKIFRTVTFLVISAVATLSINEYRTEQRVRNERIALLQEQILQYEEKLSTCVNSREIFPFTYKSNPRSRDRLEEVSAAFNEIVTAPCFEKGDQKIYKNPYVGVDLGKLSQNSINEIEVEMFEGFLYEFDKGVPFLRSGMTLCEDGSLSYSRGSGTCSWHGGYARQRGERFYLNASTIEPDPRDELSEILGK
jgi:hypothetical protein